MQKIYLLFFILFCFTNCDNDDDAPQNPVDQLPEATQTGAGTFACLIDGKPFVGDNPYFNCFYQYVDGGYYFGISGNNKSQPFSLNLSTIKKEIFEGETYGLLNEDEGNVFGTGAFTVNEVYAVFATTNLSYTGEMTITKLDFENHIVSGTFWFNLQHPVTGDTVKIREGRFDTLFGM